MSLMLKASLLQSKELKLGLKRLVQAYSRRSQRIKTEEKAKDVASAWGEEFIKNRMNTSFFFQIILVQFIISFKASWCNSSYNSNCPEQNSQRGKDLYLFFCLFSSFTSSGIGQDRSISKGIVGMRTAKSQKLLLVAGRIVGMRSSKSSSLASYSRVLRSGKTCLTFTLQSLKFAQQLRGNASLFFQIFIKSLLGM